MKIVMICVSSEKKNLEVSRPFINLVNPLPAPPRRTIERVKYVSDERNKAIQIAIDKIPYITHIMMIDSYYIDNKINNFTAFADWYENINLSNSIVGASCYQVRDIRLLSEPMISFVEVWSTPEAVDSPMVESKQSGLIRVQAVGSIYIFPIEAWINNHYKAKEDYFLPEHIDFCRNSNIPVYLSFDHKFYKPDERYSLWKKLRITGGYLRRKYVYH